MAFAAKAGFYGGTYFKAGQALPSGVAEETSADLSALSKAQLLEKAQAEGVEIKSSATKAELIAALQAN